jgi:hypothetical protein
MMVFFLVVFFFFFQLLIMLLVNDSHKRCSNPMIKVLVSICKVLWVQLLVLATRGC